MYVMGMNVAVVFLGIVLHSFTVFADVPPIAIYHLYTNKAHKHPIHLTTLSVHLLKGAEKIAFIIPGWTQDPKTYLFPDLRKAYLSSKNTRYHVVEVDWSSVSKSPYLMACSKAPLIGKTIAKFILHIIEIANLQFDQIELNGHSLGVHVAAFVGKEVEALSGHKLGKLIGLDPAGPGFVMKAEHERLSPNDADVVLVIHTDGLAFGYFDPCGTVDVYINEGKAPQKGCPDHDIIPHSGCSHERSLKYYAEALITGQFHAWKCNSHIEFKEGKCDKNEKVNLGGNVTKQDHGIFYVDTNPKSPFAKE